MTRLSDLPKLEPIKTGDALSLPCTYKLDGVAYSVETYTIRSQIRDSSGALVAELVVTKLDQALNVGGFVLSAASTSNWKTDLMRCDIQITEAGSPRSSETFLIPIIGDVTHD